MVHICEDLGTFVNGLISNDDQYNFVPDSLKWIYVMWNATSFGRAINISNHTLWFGLYHHVKPVCCKDKSCELFGFSQYSVAYILW